MDNENIIPFPKKSPLNANVEEFLASLAETMGERTIERVWEKEPDQEEWMVSCIALMRVKMHRSKRIEKKWRKKYGYQPKTVQLHCLMVRHPELLHWCGYVGVPRGHLNYKVDYDHIDASAHGGLTFGRMARSMPYRTGHYYIGFDCAHFEDYVPGYEAIFKNIGGPPRSYPMYSTYRDYNFVKNEVQELADQFNITKIEVYQKEKNQ